MGIDEFLGGFDTVKEEIDTLQIDYSEFIIDAFRETLRDPDTGRIKYSFLEDANKRNDLFNKINTGFNDLVKTRYERGGIKTDFKDLPDETKLMMMRGYLGHTPLEWKGLIDAQKSQWNYPALNEVIDKLLKPAFQNINENNMINLVGVSAQDVMAKIGKNIAYPEGYKGIDMDKLTQAGMAEYAGLLAEFKENGVVRPVYLKEKPYLQKSNIVSIPQNSANAA